MAIKTITYTNTINGVLTDVTSAVLRDPTNTYGVRRNDTNGVIVASGTPLVHVSTGVYQYSFNEPANNLSFDYWIERVYAGNTKRTKQTLQGTVAGATGTVAVAPGAYVTLGVTTVACGDAELEEFLTAQANRVWAIQARRGVTLDLNYQYFTLGLIDLALDHVRGLIDTEISNQQMQATSYANSDTLSDNSTESSRIARASSEQSSLSTQTSTRSASRSSLNSMNASATQTSRRDGAGSDTSTQTQTLDNDHDGQRHITTTTTPFLHTKSDQFKESHVLESEVNTSNIDSVTHRSVSFPFLGGFTAQFGRRHMDPDQNRSKFKMTDDNHGLTESSQRHTVVTEGLADENFDTQTTDGEGERINAVSRTSTSTMTGSATSTSSGTMTSISHDESHRNATSTAHSESSGHAESTGGGTSHRTGQGASSMISSGASDHQFYSQIFESLLKMWDNTMEQIKALEQQVLMPQRVQIRKLSTITPRATLVATAAGRTNAILGPAGLRFIDGRVNR